MANKFECLGTPRWEDEDFYRIDSFMKLLFLGFKLEMDMLRYRVKMLNVVDYD